MITLDHAFVDTLAPVISLHPSTANVRQSATKRAGTGHNYTTQVLLTILPLVIADLLALIGCIFLAFTVLDSFAQDYRPNWPPLLIWLSAAFLVTYLMFGLYPGTGHNPITELRQISAATTLLFTVFLLRVVCFIMGSP
jgi:hypothetical protein